MAQPIGASTFAARLPLKPAGGSRALARSASLAPRRG